MFNPSRLSVARKRRKFTKKHLAEVTGLSSLTLTRLEKGLHAPEPETIEKLANALGFPIDFLHGDDLDHISTDVVSFRKLSKLKSRDEQAALACADIGTMVNDWLSDKFNLPKVDLPDYSADYEPNSAALSLRQYWGIGNKPIVDIVKLLESKGIRIFSLREDIKTVDAFSFWRGNTPFVFLNTFKTVERSRFDLAHELGHLVMHVGGRINDDQKAIEKEADTFASCFLMPEADIRSNIRKNVNLNYLISAKLRWKVSLASLCYRMHNLGIISDWTFRGFYIQISQNYRQSEPNSIGEISSTLWDMVFKFLWKKKITKSKICDELNIPLEELENITNFSRQNENNNKNIKDKLRLM